MTDITLEQRARELAAKELEKLIREAGDLDFDDYTIGALEAGVAALRLSAGADWALVPREPTEAMRDAFRSVIDNPHAQWHTWPVRFQGAYQAVLAAAPRHEPGEG